MKLTTTKTLAATCWLAALIAVAAAATQHQTAMGIAGLVGAAAAIAWGLVRTLADEPIDMTGYREQVWARREGELDEGELPYRAPVVTETIYRSPLEWQHIEGGKRALWPNEIGSIE
jgi:hypothetical protein